MKILFVLLVIAGLWFWNSTKTPTNTEPGVVAAESAASSPTMVENVEHWLREHTPKK